MKKFDFFIFTADLAKKIPKNDVTRRKNFDFRTTNIFYNFWLSFSPIGPFFGNLCHFSFITCFVLEVPKNQWFLQIIFWKRHIWKWFACNCVKFLKKFRTSAFLTIDCYIRRIYVAILPKISLVLVNGHYLGIYNCARSRAHRISRRISIRSIWNLGGWFIGL